jgi:hypothetical protein
MEAGMFGKPQWFRPKTLGFGLVPISWQGWLYTASWASAIGLPFLVLITRRQPLEAMGWMGLAVGALTYDVWQILQAIRGPVASAGRGAAPSAAKQDDNVLYILDSQPGQAVATRNYNLQVRR